MRRSEPTTVIPSVALIVAGAGEGTRLGLGIPKALVPIGGVPMIRRTLDRFAGCSEISEIIVTAPTACVGRFTQVIEEGATTIGGRAVVVHVVAGGETRQQSVERGLSALTSSAVLVCVHDAARVLVSHATIRAVVAAAARSGAATAASRPADSVREQFTTGASRALDRGTLWLIETPQVFTRDLLEDAHRLARERGFDATDDATLVERMCGTMVAIVASEGPNVKVTTRVDLELVEALCRD